ncbi:hypothetical protein [uncultured Pontibacter sp.]|uniref:hypothetical protein n=1 Tax=uncultured Pontibacter sp. TaxID=453356 RepID=UPI00260799C3|nr:hypothetical protein [uncultured Pontibacter sp.]
MNDKEQAFISAWQKYHEKGKAVYLAGYALVYAAITAIITLLFRWGDAPIQDLLLTKEFLTRLVLFMLIGLIFAHFKWKTNENRYNEIKNNSGQRR